jgi:hypothetical protein
MKFSPRTVVNHLFVWLAAAVILIEEWTWDALLGLTSLIGRLPLVRWLEARIAALPPWAAMLVFLVPWSLLLPLKLAALWLLAQGYALFGVSLILLAKIAGTAWAARIFTLTRPALMSIRWFARLHDWVLDFKARIMARLRSLPEWQRAQTAIARVKAAVHAWLERKASRQMRWLAAKRIAKRQL